MILADQDSPEAAVWQLVESCGYTADLAVWTELADGSSTVLDLGCGIGRVARHLAWNGLEVVGVDNDPVLIEDLNRLSHGESVAGIVASVTDLTDVDLGHDQFETILAPQQLLHILGGADSRRRAFEGVKGLLASGGTAAFAISEWIPEGSREVEILPDVREIGNWVYASRPIAVEDNGDSITIVRLRQIVAPDGTLDESQDSITLDRMDRHTVAAELDEAGLKVERTIDVSQTDRHIATAVVVAHHAAEVN